VAAQVNVYIMGIDRAWEKERKKERKKKKKKKKKKKTHGAPLFQENPASLFPGF
jgi:hypothetical protein